jgi:serine O-acetyltransferase
MRLRELLDADWRRLLLFSGQQPRRRTVLSHLSPRFASVVLIRVAQRLHAKGWRRLAKLFSFFNFLIFSIEVSPRVEIGPGLIIPHSTGTVIGAGQIGANATIYQQVTFGATIADFEFDKAQRPILEDDVIVTAGAKIIGPVRLGKGCIVGANAVVLNDVPDGMLAVGVPARMIARSAR